MKTVTIYTDGACSGNPGPGGWGAVLRYGAHERELSGGEAQTTNNRMELTAVIEALRLLKEPCEVELYSDSKYVIDALSKGWVYGWKKKGWIKSDKRPALNVDLWQELLPLLQDNGCIYVGDVAFATRAQLEQCKAQAGDDWDASEIYFVYDELKQAFPQLRFEPVSHCAGLLTLKK